MPSSDFSILPAEHFVHLGEPQRQLMSSVRAGTLPHAVLLLGMPGTGKRTLARHLAAALLCTGEGERPCMRCRACKRVAARTHSDLLMPDAGENDRTIKVDQLRDIIRALSMHAGEGGRRVVLLENAHRMNLQAQNALLKSLEEPDEDTTFLLTASSEAQLLPTVRSRCRVTRIPPWETERIEQELLRLGCDAAQAHELAVMSLGSLGSAIEHMSSPAFAALRETVESTFFSVASAQDVPIFSARLKDSKDTAADLLDLMEQLCHEYLLHAHGLGAAPQLAKARSAELWENASPRTLEKILDGIIAARKYKEANVSWQAIAERLLYLISEENL